jgi:hypothetical protein
MQNFTSTQLALAAVLAVVIVVLLFRPRSKRSRGSGSERVPSRGPATLNFFCARCSVQTLHTRRTISAWEKGSRRFFCNNCHKNWREAQPPSNTPQSSVSRSGSMGAEGRSPVSASRPTSRPQIQSPAKSGCLGVLVLMVAVPALAIVAVLTYA